MIARWSNCTPLLIVLPNIELLWISSPYTWLKPIIGGFSNKEYRSLDLSYITPFRMESPKIRIRFVVAAFLLLIQLPYRIIWFPYTISVLGTIVGRNGNS